MHMIELKALMNVDCSEEQAEHYADLLCDYLMDLDAVPCGSIADVVSLTLTEAEEIFNYEPELEEAKDAEAHAEQDVEQMASDQASVN